MIALGYHLYSLIAHVTGPIRKDFMEFLLHHLITILLIFTGYFLNFIPISGMISMIHDISDIFIYLSKTFVDTPFDKITLTFYACIMVSFAYTRLYVYPFHLLYNCLWFNTTTKDDIPGFYLMCVITHVLLLLHIYWYILLAKLGYDFATTGKAKDIHEHDNKDVPEVTLTKGKEKAT